MHKRSLVITSRPSYFSCILYWDLEMLNFLLLYSLLESSAMESDWLLTSPIRPMASIVSYYMILFPHVEDI
jgi:hypothetical protein